MQSKFSVSISDLNEEEDGGSSAKQNACWGGSIALGEEKKEQRENT
jgi:hypothetical protein